MIIEQQVKPSRRLMMNAARRRQVDAEASPLLSQREFESGHKTPQLLKGTEEKKQGNLFFCLSPQSLSFHPPLLCTHTTVRVCEGECLPFHQVFRPRSKK